MANAKISALTSATTPLAGTETLPVVQSSTTKQVSVANLTAGRAVSMLSATVGPNPLALAGAVIDAGKDQNSPTRFGISNQNSGASATAGIDFQAAGGGWQLDVPVDIVTFANPFIGKFNGTEKFRFTADGNYVPKTAAKGINFTANTPAAGMTSQLLNWYEEGTWTPVGVNFTVVGTPTVVGKYIRIGKYVTVTATFKATTSTSSTVNSTYFTGLPFTPISPGTVTVVGNAAVTSYGVGLVDTSSAIYTPTWTSGANQTITLVGSYYLI